VHILGLNKTEAYEPVDEVRLSSRPHLVERDAPLQAERKGSGLMPECSNPNCSMGWTRMLRRRNTPMFEGEWVCSEHCIRERVMKMLRLETQTGRARDPQTPHQHRVPLGLVLLAQGWITHPQLRQALEAQQRSGQGRIGSWLMSEFGVREERITKALSLQWSCPVVTSDGFEPIRMATVAPMFFSESLGAVPLRIAGGKILYVAFEDRVDISAAVAIEKMSGLRVECGLMDGSQIQQARRRLMNSAFAPCKTPIASDLNDLADSIASDIESARPLESRLARVHQQYWLRMWHRKPEQNAVGDLPTAPSSVSDVLYTLTSVGN